MPARKVQNLERRPQSAHDPGMSGMRKAGLALAGAATLCWVVVVWALIFADGSPVGPAMIAMLGFVLTIAAMIVLLPTLPSAAQDPGHNKRIRELAVALAAVAIVLLVLTLVLGANDLATGATLRPMLLGGVVAFIASTVIIAALPSKRM
jgi:quinol-cytochrome oxidoreductase complex cytochrome b subunit